MVRLIVIWMFFISQYIIEPGLSINAQSLIQNGEEDEEGTPEQDHPSKVTTICSYSITIALFTTSCISVYTLPPAPLGSLGGSATVPDGNTSTTDYSHYSYCHFLNPVDSEPHSLH